MMLLKGWYLASLCLSLCGFRVVTDDGMHVSAGVRKRSGDEEKFRSPASLKKKPRRLDALAYSFSNPSAGQDLISSLPDECIRLIFSFLPSPRDRCSCAAVSRKWLLLQAHMRPSDFRSLSATAALSSRREHGDDSNIGAAASRYVRSHKANDARLAAMAVGACARGAPAELVIRATATTSDPAPVSSLLIVSDMGLSVISQAFPELRSLFLWDCPRVGNEGLAAVACNCPALEKLHVSNAPLVGDGGLIFILMRCSKLSDLSLEACPRVGDGALRTLPLMSSHLESITLQNCPMVRDASLVAVLSFLPRLAKVRIADAKVGDGALEAIGARGDGNPVRSVCLENVTGFTHVGFRRLGLAASLQSLTVRCCTGLSDACFDSGGSCNAGGDGALWEPTFVGLRSVTLRSCGAFTDRGLMHLSETSKQMESLQLEKCHGITTVGLMGAVRNWSGTLRLLSMVKCNGIGTRTQKQQQQQREHGAVVPAPAPIKCPLLQSLTIKRCPGVGDPFLSVMGGVLISARRIAVVGMGSITDGGFISLLASMECRSDVQSVDLSGCTGITDWSVAALVSASGGALRRLTLEGCEGVTDRSLRMIGRLCPALVELDLSGCRRITDGGVAGLLASGGHPVAGGGGDAGDGDSGSSSKERKSRLEVLSLEGCGGISDESLSSLEEMVVRGSLAGLNLKHCGGLTRAGIDSVRQTLWWCDLIS
ncbi:hypothetical protein Taro_050750 [Colocasia esculenta]|uniref:F-box domain-containing protein n=1 Tax=Colocasia esculenta TaxID=4460 RepID=A0A843XET3_COLES|nr:hypothetical protein [Colocasia esculenta]